MIEIVYRGGPADGQHRAILPDPDGVPPLSVGGFIDCWDFGGCGTHRHDSWKHDLVYERPIALPAEGPVIYTYAGGDDRTDTCRAIANNPGEYTRHDYEARWANFERGTVAAAS